MYMRQGAFLNISSEPQFNMSPNWPIDKYKQGK